MALSTIGVVSEGVVDEDLRLGQARRRLRQLGKIAFAFRKPARALALSTRASEQSMRSTSCSLDISSEKKATPTLGSASIAA